MAADPSNTKTVAFLILLVSAFGLFNVLFLIDPPPNIGLTTASEFQPIITDSGGGVIGIFISMINALPVLIANLENLAVYVNPYIFAMLLFPVVSYVLIVAIANIIRG